jgi:phosphohistidine phosphatase SixA
MHTFLRALTVLALVPLAALPAPTKQAERALAAPAVQQRTVVLVRHAEKDPAPADPRDPGLSEAGRARAEELARLLAAARATALFSSEFRRTRDTLAPLAARLQLDVQALPAAQPADLLARLDALPPGSVAVVCGHSNTLPELAARLGAPLPGLAESKAGRVLPDEAYDRLFVLTRPAGGDAAPACLELRYGATSSAGR